MQEQDLSLAEIERLFLLKVGVADLRGRSPVKDVHMENGMTPSRVCAFRRRDFTEVQDWMALICSCRGLFVPAAFAFKLPDTGQTKCYQVVSPYAEIPRAGTGQDGAYSINPMSYTDNGNGTVTDNNTGLMWQQQDDGKSIQLVPGVGHL
ncbi:MAG: DUF1566 domain-containing protein [Desulfomicrobium escambiense]|nr:DUF1566 domain-containing protein [Desulfomicrobium escambiense]